MRMPICALCFTTARATTTATTMTPVTIHVVSVKTAAPAYRKSASHVDVQKHRHIHRPIYRMRSAVVHIAARSNETLMKTMAISTRACCHESAEEDFIPCNLLVCSNN
jgi:hypothetical protein